MHDFLLIVSNRIFKTITQIIDSVTISFLNLKFFHNLEHGVYASDASIQH